MIWMKGIPLLEKGFPTFKIWVTLRSSTDSSIIFYMRIKSSITFSSNRLKTPSQQDNIVSLVWSYIRAIIIINLTLHTSMIAMANSWHWFIQITENGSNTEKRKFNTLMLSRQWMKSSGGKKDNGLRSCSCIDKFTWETCKSNKTKIKK